jgi:hypothetical protein
VTITVSGQNYDVQATDLESLGELGRGAYGIVEKRRHAPSGLIMAVKVNIQRFCFLLAKLNVILVLIIVKME